MVVEWVFDHLVVRILHRMLGKLQASWMVLRLLQITTAAQLEAPTRSLAAECLVTLCEARDKAPGMVRRLPNFVPTLFAALMSFLLDVEDLPEWHRVGDWPRSSFAVDRYAAMRSSPSTSASSLYLQQLSVTRSSVCMSMDMPLQRWGHNIANWNAAT